MATAIMEPEIIETAMSNIGLKDRAGELLDEIELQRRLKISEEQDKIGLYEPTEKVVEEILGELASGRYARR